MNENNPSALIKISILLLGLVALGVLVFLMKSQNDETASPGATEVEKDVRGIEDREVPPVNTAPSGESDRSPTNQTERPVSPTTTMSEEQILSEGRLPDGSLPPTPGGQDSIRMNAEPTPDQRPIVPVQTDAEGNPTGDVPNPDDYLTTPPPATE